MKKIIKLFVVFAMLLSLVACKKDTKDSKKIYYLSSDKFSIVGVDYQYKTDDVSAQVKEALEMLAKETEDVDYMMTIPSSVSIGNWEIDNDSLSLYITGDYRAMDVYTEVLVRAAIVKTMVQIDGVDSVSFYVDNKPLEDSSGIALGAMTAETFIDDFGAETDSLLSTELTLFFASPDGTSLVSEERQVYYSRNIPIEKLIVEQILKGTDSDDCLNTVPAGTKLNSISVTDGVCFVNFDSTFESEISGVTEMVTTYSIVNSLTQLDAIKQVQILVNGEKPHYSSVDLAKEAGKGFSRNTDIININYSNEEEYSWEESE